ncbi:carbohydrate ABC transporter permease [Paenibacillus hamazuiensis]|uniref:carbohydrate ABC transporter permease n=1 Tax=Paenibacillus hamazuiensis TaxID=2936508 RepID=UPI00200D4E01|nr:sugar ABC transporter permease [Paenibacillus hamazuiensis]
MEMAIEETMATEKSMKKKRDRRFVTPKYVVFISIAFLAVITQVPFVITLYFSTLDWNLLYPQLGKQFVGLSNYAHLFTDVLFYQAVWTTLKLSVIILSVSLVIGLLLATMLHRQFVGKTIVRNLLFAPFLVMTTVTALVWKNMMMDPSYGFIAALFKLLGMTPPDIIGNHPVATVVTVAVWSWTPFMMLILHAALESIPEEVMEASRMDGAGRVTTFFHIVLPFLQQYVFICVLLGSIMIIPLFGEIALITAGGPGKVTTNLSYFVFEEAFHGYNLGSASASGVVASFITMFFGSILIRMFQGRKGTA